MSRRALRHFGNTSVAVLIFVVVLAFQALAQTVPAGRDADARAEAILKQMTLQEKIDFIGGTDGFFVRAIPRLEVPRIKMADGPLGVRNFGPATAMAGGIGLAATWNPLLAERVGAQIGRDARAKGVHYLLGPGVNIYVAPMNGRNFEYMGEDPFLASRIAVGYIEGVQQEGVSATIKHFMANNSEYDRHNVDAAIDERTLREIYLPVFEAGVKEAKVGAIMDSYNLVNGEHMTQNGYLNTDIVRKEWGFKGIVMSDWVATYDAVGAANGGLDLEMPSADFMNQAKLIPAIQQRKVSIETIDEKVRRILRTSIAFGWFDRDQTDLTIPRYNLQGREVALEGAREAMVLLKNEGNLLPLDKKLVKSVAIIGPDAYPAVPVGGGSARVEPFAGVSFLQGLANTLGDSVAIYYNRGLPTFNEIAERTNFSTGQDGKARGLKAEFFANPTLSGTPFAARVDEHVAFGHGYEIPGFHGESTNRNTTGFSVRWTGYYTPDKAGNHSIFVQGPGEGGGYRLFVDDKPVIDSWRGSYELTGQAKVALTAVPHKIVLEQFRNYKFGRTRIEMGIAREGTLVSSEATALAAKADAVIVAAGFEPSTESEGADRTFALPIGQDELIRDMAAANKRTIVALTSGGSVDMNGWLDRIPALIEAWYPGQEGGTALAGIVFGDVNPSGRLPVTFERRWEDNPSHDSYYPQPGTNRIVYKNGVFVGYRGYEHNGTRALFPFGFGLSYTTFKYANLEINPSAQAGSYELAFDVTNTGTRPGADVAQVYVGEVNPKIARPVKELKGFSKVSLKPGQTKHVTVSLDQRAFSYYDVNGKQWKADPGAYNVLVGRSSEQIELKGVITLK